MRGKSFHKTEMATTEAKRVIDEIFTVPEGNSFKYEQSVNSLEKVLYDA